MRAAITKILPAPGDVQLALREIAEAREHLRLASDVLSALDTSEATQVCPATVAEELCQLEIGQPPHYHLDVGMRRFTRSFPSDWRKERGARLSNACVGGSFILPLVVVSLSSKPSQ